MRRRSVIVSSRPLAGDFAPRLTAVALGAFLLVAAALVPATRAGAAGEAGDNPTAPTIAAPAPVRDSTADSASVASVPHAAAVVPAPVKPASVPVSAAAPALLPPTDLRHVSEWTAYRARRHLASLPAEARLFYRRGLIARQSGQNAEALMDVRGAAELDPTFVEPHLTLAAWLLTSEPGQALQQYAAVLELVRGDFNLQVELLANAVIVGYQALFAGLLFAALIMVWLRREEILHGWREGLSRFGTARGARLWAPALLALPFLAGFGITIPTVGFLAYLWPHQRARERVVAVLLVIAVFAIPSVVRVTERLALPLHEDSAPFYGITLLENAAYSPEREARLQSLASHSGDPILQFGYAWTARRGAHLPEAEAAYRKVAAAWPGSARAWNNLGNVLAMQGRDDDALACYRKASSIDPEDAAALFNMAQILTQRYDYQAASDALSRASALNFDLVRTYQSQATTDGLLPLIDQWLEPREFWQALRAARIPSDMAGVVPISLRSHVELDGWPFLALVLLALAAGAWGAVWQHRFIALRACNNCGTVLCRRCSIRRREQALCPSCAEAESQGETPEFARLLLLKQRQERLRREHLFNTAFAALVPGYGLLACRRAFTPVLLLSLSWLIAWAWRDTAALFAIEPRLLIPGSDVPAVAVVAGILFVYGTSLLGWFHLAARARARELALQQASKHSRVQQSTRRSFQTAA